MDNQIHTDIDEYIASSRIRTARRRLRDAKTQYDKTLLSLNRQEFELRRAWNQRGYVPLEPPVMKGYKRFFVLRDDVERSRMADFYRQLLQKINTFEYSHRRDFKVKKRSHGRKKLVEKPQALLHPDAAHFKRLQFSDKEAACFEERFVFIGRCKEPVKRYVFKEPWRFVLRVRPNMITQTRMIIPELLSQMDQLDNYIKRRQLQHRIFKLTRSKSFGKRHWIFTDKKKYKHPHRTLQQILQDEWFDKN
ncbi:hypothetical protein HGH93_27325 [Chitinophaga polysaccharea]|uniref:hypothetical protein n=1 Tax=Chitinophaga polysaccharea TaxID=1293035 RepID=UPI0014552EB0|nr:hypothetical protein [Chitinophaga polysaccharea]NLR61838.1 hypothetical protein [Chitinophaga polysaccharea]